MYNKGSQVLIIMKTLKKYFEEEFLSAIIPSNYFGRAEFRKDLIYLQIRNQKMSHNYKDKAMSKSFYVLLFLLGFIMGCGKYSDPVGPVDSAESVEPNWIAIPSAENKSLEKEVLTGKWICGDKRSVLNIRTSYPAYTPFRYVRINALAVFQKNSFEGCSFITMSISDNFGITTFEPEINFSKPVLYSLTISGVDLSSIDPNTVKFVYMAEDGQYYPAECDYIRADPRLGLLQVVNARLPHFSRYGFAN